MCIGTVQRCNALLQLHCPACTKSEVCLKCRRLKSLARPRACIPSLTGGHCEFGPCGFANLHAVGGWSSSPISGLGANFLLQKASLAFGERHGSQLWLPLWASSLEVRDLSMNGTGLKLGDDKPAVPRWRIYCAMVKGRGLGLDRPAGWIPLKTIGFLCLGH